MALPRPASIFDDAGWNHSLGYSTEPTNGKGGASEGVSKAKATPAPKGAIGKKPAEKKKNKPELEPDPDDLERAREAYRQRESEPKPELEPDPDDLERAREAARQCGPEPDPDDDCAMRSWDNSDKDQHYFTLGADEDGRPGGPYNARSGSPVPEEERTDPYADRYYDPNYFRSLSAKGERPDSPPGAASAVVMYKSLGPDDPDD